MTLREKYTLEIGNVERLINQLQKGQIRERDDVPGVPSAQTLGNNLAEAFETLLRKIEADAPGDIQTVADRIER
ncbi:MAG: hypothetical protein IJX82_07745 [Clostridia bacterium]|nr:hypothetical protein [Clostridia bacterium]